MDVDEVDSPPDSVAPTDGDASAVDHEPAVKRKSRSRKRDSKERAGSTRASGKGQSPKAPKRRGARSKAEPKLPEQASLLTGIVEENSSDTEGFHGLGGSARLRSDEDLQPKALLESDAPPVTPRPELDEDLNDDDLDPKALLERDGPPAPPRPGLDEDLNDDDLDPKALLELDAKPIGPTDEDDDLDPKALLELDAKPIGPTDEDDGLDPKALLEREPGSQRTSAHGGPLGDDDLDDDSLDTGMLLEQDEPSSKGSSGLDATSLDDAEDDLDPKALLERDDPPRTTRYAIDVTGDDDLDPEAWRERDRSRRAAQDPTTDDDDLDTAVLLEREPGSRGTSSRSATLGDDASIDDGLDDDSLDIEKLLERDTPSSVGDPGRDAARSDDTGDAASAALQDGDAPQPRSLGSATDDHVDNRADDLEDARRLERDIQPPSTRFESEPIDASKPAASTRALEKATPTAERLAAPTVRRRNRSLAPALEDRLVVRPARIDARTAAKRSNARYPSATRTTESLRPPSETRSSARRSIPPPEQRLGSPAADAAAQQPRGVDGRGAGSTLRRDPVSRDRVAPPTPNVLRASLPIASDIRAEATDEERPEAPMTSTDERDESTPASKVSQPPTSAPQAGDASDRVAGFVDRTETDDESSEDIDDLPFFDERPPAPRIDERSPFDRDSNPFSVRGSDIAKLLAANSGEEAPAADSWLGSQVAASFDGLSLERFFQGDDNSVASGVQAMLSQSEVAPSVDSEKALSRVFESEEPPDSGPSTPSALISERPTVESLGAPAESEPPSEERFPSLAGRLNSDLNLTPSTQDFRPAPSLSALDNALGNVLGGELGDALERGVGNMASQLDDLMATGSDSIFPGAEVDFGQLSDQFDARELSDANLASKIPPPADTMRGAETSSKSAVTNTRTLKPTVTDGQWLGVPGQVDVERLRRGTEKPAGEQEHDVDSGRMSALWEGEDDDTAEPAAALTETPGEAQAEEESEWDAPPDSDWGAAPQTPPATQTEPPGSGEEPFEYSPPPPSGRETADESLRHLPSSIPPPEPRRAAPRQPIRAIWIAAVLVLLGVAVTLLPWYLLQRAEKRATKCFQDIIRTAEGDPDGCRPNTTELTLARNLPWLANDARRITEWSDFRAARLEFDKATAIVPNAKRRDEAAQKLLDLTYRGSSSERTAALGVVAGAHAAVTRFALANREPEAMSFALRSARALADIESMRALASGSGADDLFGMSLRRGALLCLLGDANEGARAFVQADLAHQRLNTTMEGNQLARLGLVACDRSTGIDGEVDAHRINERVRPAMAALEASLDTQEGFRAARDFLEGEKYSVGGVQRLRIAPWVIRETKPSALEALRLLAPRRGSTARLDLISMRSPWSMLNVEVPVQAVYMDPTAAEAAAAYLVKIADRIGGRSIDCSGAECPDEAAIEVPQAVLAEAARMFLFESAAEHARLGHRESAIEAASRVLEMSAEKRRHHVAPLLLAVGDAEGALKALEPALARTDEYSGVGQLRIHLNEALALAHLGRFDQAMAAAEKAFYASGKANVELSTKKESLDEEVALQDDRVSAAWLWCAMSLLAGKPDRLGAALGDESSQELADVISWSRLAAQPEELRRRERWELSLATMSESALPAVMYVVSRAVPSMTDVEVWLDRIFQQEHRTQPTRAMLARAEVARWRNDPDAERTWKGRASTVLGLAKDYRSSLLAHILELR